MYVLRKSLSLRDKPESGEKLGAQSTALETLSREMNSIRNLNCRDLLILQCFQRGLPTCAIHFVTTLLDECDG